MGEKPEKYAGLISIGDQITATLSVRRRLHKKETPTGRHKPTFTPIAFARPPLVPPVPDDTPRVMSSHPADTLAGAGVVTHHRM